MQGWTVANRTWFNATTHAGWQSLITPRKSVGPTTGSGLDSTSGAGGQCLTTTAINKARACSVPTGCAFACVSAAARPPEASSLLLLSPRCTLPTDAQLKNISRVNETWYLNLSPHNGNYPPTGPRGNASYGLPDYRYFYDSLLESNALARPNWLNYFTICLRTNPIPGPAPVAIGAPPSGGAAPVAVRTVALLLRAQDLDSLQGLDRGAGDQGAALEGPVGALLASSDAAQPREAAEGGAAPSSPAGTPEVSVVQVVFDGLVVRVGAVVSATEGSAVVLDEQVVAAVEAAVRAALGDAAAAAAKGITVALAAAAEKEDEATLTSSEAHMAQFSWTSTEAAVAPAPAQAAPATVPGGVRRRAFGRRLVGVAPASASGAAGSSDSSSSTSTSSAIVAAVEQLAGAATNATTTAVVASAAAAASGEVAPSTEGGVPAAEAASATANGEADGSSSSRDATVPAAAAPPAPPVALSVSIGCGFDASAAKLVASRLTESLLAATTGAASAQQTAAAAQGGPGSPLVVAIAGAAPTTLANLTVTLSGASGALRGASETSPPPSSRCARPCWHLRR